MKRTRLLALTAALLLLLAGCRSTEPDQIPTDSTSVRPDLAQDPTEEPLSSEIRDEITTPEPTPTAEPAKAYVLVSWSTGSGWLPLAPEGQSYSYPLQQVDAEGRLLENVIHITDSAVWMESATCDNQDCVKQGEVTLENRDLRVLSNMIICLPQQVSLQLFTPEEIQAMYP